ATARNSLWPFVVALGATTVTLGLVTTRAFFVIGMVVIVAGALEWIVQAWAERASADGAFNRDARERLIDPLELPIAGAAGAGIVVYAFSRVMLGLPSKSSTIVAFAVAGALVLAVGAIVGFARNASKATLAGTFSLVAVALVAGGAV